MIKCESEYRQGDIVGVMGGTMSKASNVIFTPPTRLYHFLIIGRPVPIDSDYEIFESIASGVRMGRLSWYENDAYVIFRVREAGDLGKIAVQEASNFGRWGYDYLMYVYLLIDVVKIFGKMLIQERRIRRIDPCELTFRDNHAFICTEFANAVHKRGGRPPIPNGVTALPAGFIRAYMDRKLDIVGFNIPEGCDEIPIIPDRETGAGVVNPDPLTALAKD